MQDKKSFVLYADLLHTISKLPDEDAGKLFKLILEYVNDKTPDESKYGLLVEVAFEQIKQQLKRDLRKWGEIREKRSEAGKKSAEVRKEQKQQMLTHVESVKQDPTKSTVSVNDNVNVTAVAPTIEEFIQFFKEEGYTSDSAKEAYQYYHDNEWVNKAGDNVLKTWRFHVRKQWFKEESKKSSTRTFKTVADFIMAQGEGDNNA